MSLVLAPDRPIGMVAAGLAIARSVERVEDAANQNQEPGEYCKDFVGYERLSGMGFPFGEWVDCMSINVDMTGLKYCRRSQERAGLVDCMGRQ